MEISQSEWFDDTIHPAVEPFDDFNANDDAKTLRKAMKGLGTDEDAIIGVLCYRSNEQRQQIAKAFKQQYGKDLIKDLKGELSGNFENLVLALMTTPRQYDAQQLRQAMKGAGTDEADLIEIMCTRSNAEIEEIKQVYQTTFKRDLEKDLMSETSGHFRRLLVSMCCANRDETVDVDLEKARQDADRLYQAGEATLGTDESCFNEILAAQNFAQLQAVFVEYKALAGRNIDKSIKREMSGDLAKGFLAVVEVVYNRPAYFAQRLHAAMKGLGTNDNDLIRIIVTRSETDLLEVKEAFSAIYGKRLGLAIKSETSGHYKRALMEICREWNV